MSDSRPASSSEVPLISIIIPTLNEERHITACLRALELQTISPEQFEVIVVDNGSTDATLDKIDAFTGLPYLTVVSRTGCTISALRNEGAARARGKVLGFLDADCIPLPEWLELSLARASEADLWGADYALPQDATWVGRVWHLHQAKEHDGEVTFLPGGSVFAARSTFDAVGGFPESFRTAEDVEFSARARRQGRRVIAIPSLAVAHLGTPRTLMHFYRKNRWHGTHVIRMFLANLPSTRSLPVVALSVYTLVAFWATVLGLPASLLLHRHLLAWLPLTLLLLPPIALGTVKCIQSKNLLDLPALALLYLTYLLGRAASIVRLSRDRR